MTEEELAEMLRELFGEHMENTEPDECLIYDIPIHIRDAGLLTPVKGVVVKTMTGQRFMISVQELPKGE